jgi:uncharacterized sporulation protein YeaH/YhbH (DUF444 family)
MHIVDRRLNTSGKSLENRQRFLRRAKSLVQGAVKKTSQDRDIKDVLEGGEVAIPLDGMNEPRFHTEGGVRDRVLPGNKKFVEGDILQRPQSKSGRSSDAGEGDGEDAFRFVLSRDEFVDMFLDDLELPDLSKRKLAEVENEGLRRAGYTTSGSPANISVGRTVRLAMARRVALQRPRPEAIAQLEAELDGCSEEQRPQLLAEIDRLKSKMKRIPFIDPIDIRYRQAVMFCLMDVSGSMSEHMKDLAKRFYMLLYVFLTRRYRKVEIVFIRHTDRAEEVDEQTFFHGPASGGTLVSSALETMHEIVQSRFRPADWNIYAAQASDGDNTPSDNAKTVALLTDIILPACQYFAYLEVGRDEDSLPAGLHSHPTDLWRAYEHMPEAGPRFAMRKVRHRRDIYPVFREFFRRRDGVVMGD